MFTEYTPEHADALLASPLADRVPLPHRRGPRPQAAGTAVWSRYPLIEHPTPIDAVGRTRCLSRSKPRTPSCLAVHPMSPMVCDRRMRDDSPALAGWRCPTEPTVIIGDFNAAYWHPPFRDVLDAGWRDAHQARRAVASPTRGPTADGPLPHVVRLDHALVNDGLVVTAVDDVEIPGSDHAGLVVTVTPGPG